MRQLALLSQGFRRMRFHIVLQVLVCLLGLKSSWGQADPVRREQFIPILAATSEGRATGAVVYVIVTFEKRIDQSELKITFHSAPGRFSSLAQIAIQEGVLHTARSLNLSPNYWNVTLTVPYQDVTLDGSSSSGMIALSVAAVAQGYPLPSHTVLTGTISPDGLITPVGAISLKLAAANTANIRRVIISDRQNASETFVENYPSLQVLRIRSVREALRMITETSSRP